MAYDLHELGHGITQHAFWQRAHLAMDNFAVGNEQHGRDSLNTIFHHPFRIFICVYFCDQNFAFIFLRQFVQDRRNHLAWATPWRPEIHDHRDGRLKNGFLESRVSHVNWFI